MAPDLVAVGVGRAELSLVAPAGTSRTKDSKVDRNNGFPHRNVINVKNGKTLVNMTSEEWSTHIYPLYKWPGFEKMNI